jgi:hypothetical protein
MHRRPAHSVDIINRLFSDYELGKPTAMELAGLHDELSRLERKWLIQLAEKSERRKPTDVDKLNAWFDRLTRLIGAALRRGGHAADETALLEQLLQKLQMRRQEPRTK